MDLNQHLQQIIEKLNEEAQSSRGIQKMNIQKDIRKINEWLEMDQQSRTTLPDVDFAKYGFNDLQFSAEDGKPGEDETLLDVPNFVIDNDPIQDETSEAPTQIIDTSSFNFLDDESERYQTLAEPEALVFDAAAEEIIEAEDESDREDHGDWFSSSSPTDDSTLDSEPMLNEEDDLAVFGVVENETPAAEVSSDDEMLVLEDAIEEGAISIASDFSFDEEPEAVQQPTQIEPPQQEEALPGFSLLDETGEEEESPVVESIGIDFVTEEPTESEDETILMGVPSITDAESDVVEKEDDSIDWFSPQADDSADDPEEDEIVFGEMIELDDASTELTMPDGTEHGFTMKFQTGEVGLNDEVDQGFVLPDVDPQATIIEDSVVEESDSVGFVLDEPQITIERDEPETELEDEFILGTVSESDEEDETIIESEEVGAPLSSIFSDSDENLAAETEDDLEETVIEEVIESQEEPIENLSSFDLSALETTISDDEIPDEDMLIRQKAADVYLQVGLRYYHQGVADIAAGEYVEAQKQFEFAVEQISEALKQAPMYSEAQDAQQRTYQGLQEVRYFMLMKRLEEEQDVGALQTTVEDARAYLPQITDEEKHAHFEESLSAGLIRYEEIRREQGQVTSTQNIRNLLQAAMVVIEAERILNDGQQKTIYDATVGEIVPIEDFVPRAQSNQDNLALRTFRDIRNKARLFMPEVGFRHPQTGLNYFRDRVDLDLLQTEGYQGNDRFTYDVITRYEQESEDYLQILNTEIRKLGISRRVQDQIVILLHCWKENRLIDEYEVKAIQVEENLPVSSVEDVMGIVQKQREQQKRISWDTIDSLKWLFNALEVEPDAREPFETALKNWFQQEMSIQQWANSQILIAALPGASRDEIKKLVDDWSEQQEKSQQANKLLQKIHTTSDPILQFQLLGEARHVYPFHPDLPSFEEMVLTSLPPRLESLIVDAIKVGKEKLVHEAQDAYEQRQTENEVTSVEQIKGFAEILRKIKGVNDAVGMFDRGADQIITSAQERNALIQKAFEEYLKSSDEQKNLQRIYQTACDQILDIANRSDVADIAKSRLRNYRNDIMYSSRSVLFESGDGQYAVSEPALTREREFVSELDTYLWQERQKPVAEMDIPSYIIADMQAPLDRLHHQNEILTQNQHDFSRAVEVLQTLEDTRVEVERLKAGDLAEFQHEFTQILTRRKNIRHTYQEISDLLNQGEVQEAFKAYQHLSDDFRLDPEIHFLYETEIQSSLSEDELLNQANGFYRGGQWTSCQDTCAKIKSNPALVQEARKLEDLSEMHILAELIDQLWGEEKYALTLVPFSSIEKLSAKGEGQEELLEELVDTYFLLKREEELFKKRDIDEENQVPTRLETLYKLLPEMESFLTDPDTKVDTIGSEYAQVESVDTALTEIKSMLALDTSRKGELKAWKRWFESNAFRQFQAKLSEILTANKSDIEYGYQIAMVAHRHELLYSSRIRSLCREIFIERNQVEDEKLRTRGRNEDFETMIKNWEQTAELLPLDLEIPVFLNEKRHEALLGFLDNELEELNYQLALKILSRQFNPVNGELPDQPCVHHYTDVPFRFLVDTDEALKLRRRSARALETTDLLYEQGAYRQVIDYLDTSIEEMDRLELKTQKEILGEKMILDLQSRAQQATDLIPKASAYAQILRLTDQGAPALLAKQYIEENQEQLKQVVQDRAFLAQDLVIDAQNIDYQLERVNQLESELVALVPILDYIQIPGGVGQTFTTNAIKILGGKKDHLEQAKKVFTEYDKVGKNNGWQRCLYSGNWETLEEELQKLRDHIPGNQVDLLELSDRYEFTKEQRERLSAAKSDLESNFAGGLFESALVQCNQINNILTRNDPIHRPPVDIFGLVRNNYEIFDDETNVPIRYFAPDGTENVEDVLRRRLANFSAWQDFQNKIEQQIQPENEYGEEQETVLDLPFEENGQQRKTELERIQAWIPKCKAVLEQFAVITPNIMNIKAFETQYPGYPAAAEMLPMPNNFLSVQILEELQELWKEIQSNLEISQTKLNNYVAYEATMNQQIDYATSLIKQKQMGQAQEVLTDPRGFYSGWEDYRLNEFLQYLDGLSKQR